MLKLKKIITEYPLLLIVVLLCALSCFAILNATPLITKISSPETLWIRQLVYYLIAAVIVAILYFLGNDAIYNHIKIIYYIFIFLLILLAFDHVVAYRLLGWVGNKHLVPFAHSSGGATMWFSLPGFSFQPSEFIKIIVVIYLAKITKEHNDKMLIRDFRSEINYLKDVAKIVLPPVILIYLENDTGVVMILLAGVFFVIYSSALRKQWFIVLGVILGVGIVGAVYLFIFQNDLITALLNGNRMNRIYGWLDPEGTIGSQGYQLFYSLLSYGTAGWFGHGFQAVVKNFPEAQTDFIFAVIVTDYGFIGGLVTIALSVALDVMILKIGFDSSNNRDKYFTMGIFGMLIFQQIWNIGMILGLLPITGITLPFISYGGSSLLSFMIAIAMFLDIEYQTNLLKSTQH